MSPVVLAALIGILMLIAIGGAWGHTILSGIMQRRLLAEQARNRDPALEDLTEELREMTNRLERVEEELDFFRALHDTEAPPSLPGTGVERDQR